MTGFAPRVLWTTPILSALLLAPHEALAASGQETQEHQSRRTVRAVRAEANIVVDGRLDDADWAFAEPATAFRQRDPDEGQPATERTELRVAYDDEALYVGARLHDGEPSRIVRRLSRRDESSDADSFTLYLDPQHDHLTGALFEVSAAGVQRDAVIYNDSWDDDYWDAVWAAAVALDDEGWSVEMKIPLSQLRFPAAEQQTWGINAARYIQRKNETDWFQLVPKNESGLASRMAHLNGLDRLRPRTSLEVFPYALGRSEHIMPDGPDDPFNDGSEQFGGYGLDLKFDVSSNFSLDATANPDYGQVEVDPAVVNLTDFETFFPEKRPFFLEGSQIFGNFGRNGANSFWGFNRSEPSIFYSRRIGRSPHGSAAGEFVQFPNATTILGAAKLTGKSRSGWSLGVIEAVTAREYASIFDLGQTDRTEVEPLSNYGVVRAHRDFARSGIGFLGTSVMRDLRDPELAELLPSRAFVVGLDSYLFLSDNKDWVVTDSIAASRVDGSAAAMERVQRASQRYFQRPDADQPRLDTAATSLFGWTGSVDLNRNGGNLQMNAALWGTSPGFESNDLGLNFRSDRWGGHLVGTWRKTTPDALTRRRSISLAKWYTLNFDGDRQGDGLNVSWNSEFRNYWSLGGNAFKRWRAWNDALTRGGPTAIAPAAKGGTVWIESDSRKGASVLLETLYRDNEYGGWELQNFVQLKLKPAASLEVSFGPTLLRSHAIAQWVRNVEDPTALVTYGRRHIFATLEQTEVNMTARLNWILSPRVSLQVYAQPLLSAGDYDEFKELARPRSFDFTRYYAGTGVLTFDAASDVYTVDPDASGPADPFVFGNPDFNFKSLRLNAVFRWEWRLGSTLYLVWTRSQQGSTSVGEFDLGRDLGDLFANPSDDVVLVKANIRLGR